jgi:hypothetical protein
MVGKNKLDCLLPETLHAMVGNNKLDCLLPEIFHGSPGAYPNGVVRCTTQVSCGFMDKL